MEELGTEQSYDRRHSDVNLPRRWANANVFAIAIYHMARWLVGEVGLIHLALAPMSVASDVRVSLVRALIGSRSLTSHRLCGLP